MYSPIVSLIKCMAADVVYVQHPIQQDFAHPRRMVESREGQVVESWSVFCGSWQGRLPLHMDCLNGVCGPFSGPFLLSLLTPSQILSSLH